MKSQDIVVGIALALGGDRAKPTFAELANHIGLAVSQCHQAVQRLVAGRLVDGQRRARVRSLYNFVVEGVPAVFPGKLGGPTIGVSTGAAAFEKDGVFPEDLPAPSLARWVWPDPAGLFHGLAVEPLHSTCIGIAKRPETKSLYEALALIDLVRLGDARSAAYGRRELRRLLGLGVAELPRINIREVAAVRAIFSGERLVQSVRKWLGEIQRDESAHPLEAPILVEYGEGLARQLAQDVPQFRWYASPATHVVLAKGRQIEHPEAARAGDVGLGASRDLAWPCLTDRLVARRLVDELEPHARNQADERVFFNRRFADSRASRGDYRAWFEEWQVYQASVADAATSQGLAVAFSTDIANFFPSTDLSLARTAIARETRAHSDLVDLIFECIEAWRPRLGYHRQVGLPQDPVGLSGLLAHCVLRAVDDMFADRFDRQYRRFVDDTVFFVPDKDAAAMVGRSYREALTRLGLRPNESKTSVVPASELRKEQHTEVFGQIDMAVKNKNTDLLARLTHKWMRPDISTGSLRRRLYSAHARLQTMQLDDAVKVDIHEPSHQRHAIKYLCARPLEQERWRYVQEAWAPDRTSLGRIRIARALSDVPIQNKVLADEVITWCSEHALPRSMDPPGMGHARGTLLLVLFRLAARKKVETFLDVLGRSKQFGPVFQMYVELVEVGGLAHRRFPSADAWSDLGLVQRILTDAGGGRLDDPLAVIQSALGRPGARGQKYPAKSPVPAASLPLLHAIDRGLRLGGQRRAARTMFLAIVDRLGGARDQTMAQHGHLFAEKTDGVRE